MSAPRALPIAHRPRAPRAGFALLITLTLLAFLVVLLVGLATYTRIETAIAGNTQRQEQARQNALLALSVALGQLQKYAGPDQRVTATAEAFSATNTHFTGVWSAASDVAVSTTPLTWLVSGNELLATDGTPNPLAVTPAKTLTTTGTNPNAVELVGAKTSGAANDVVAPLQRLTSVGIPGNTALSGTAIGRYAWWVGDQGVKAPVALPDNTSSITYAPYDSAELRSRIRQQISLGAGAADATGPIFEPRDSNNAPLVANGKIATASQLGLLKKTGSTTALGASAVQANFHAWSPNNFAVLANTKLGGLRQDLSLKPDLLGSAFAAWADYKSYMEDPMAPASPVPLPMFTADPLRRRYRITSPASNGNVGAAPVLAYFYVLLGVRKQTKDTPYIVSLRWAAALWNPYTSALVPEGLRLEISGLPNSVTFSSIDPNTNVATDDVTVDLRQLYGNPLKVTLPWTPSATPLPEEESWLPGRVYNWTYQQGAPLQSTGDNPGSFNTIDLGGFDDGLTVSVPGSPSVNGNSQLALRNVPTTTLTVKLMRANGDVLATYTSPTYDAVSITDPGAASNKTSQLGYPFHLAESGETGSTPDFWLTTAGRDPRTVTVGPGNLVALDSKNSGTDPTLYKNSASLHTPARYLDRNPTSGLSYNEDLPLFELPRSPMLSLGTLQHCYIPGARPFSIGNSWGNGTELNGMDIGSLFDRFFLSGLALGITPTTVNGALRLPGPLLKILPRSAATGVAVELADLQNAPDAQSSKFLLQGGAFNFNSISPAAWQAVLRSGRYISGVSFNYLDSDATTGTASDEATATLSDPIVVGNLPTAAFFRFPQSAQEVYKADEGYVQSTTPFGGETAVLDIPLFRRGMRTLTAAQIAVLAAKITDAIKAHHAASGPFRSLEEFLSPAKGVGTPSLLEQAIADANINTDASGNAIEFSSQYLTQADIMTALAPVLFPRSDTFVIRAYGEALNPTTSTATAPAVEGRAWCEAIVQRVPEYFDSGAATGDDATVAPAALTNTLNQTYGRRFKIVSFRWLTRSDI